MTILRATFKLLLGLLVIVVILVAALIAINWRDEALSPESAALLTPPSDFDDPANAAYILWAFASPAGTDAIAAGRARVNALRRLYIENPYRTDWPVSNPDDSVQVVLPPELKCEVTQACVPAFLAARAQVRDLALSQAHLLERLDQIEGARVWQDVAPPVSVSAPIPPYMNIVNTLVLEQALAAVDIDEGRIDQGVARIEKAAHVSRRLMENNRLLIGKMIGIAAWRRVLQTSQELLDKPEARAALVVSMDRWMVPMTVDELSIELPMRFEVASFASAIEHYPDMLADSGTSPADRLMRIAAPLLLKPNATKNQALEMYARQFPLLRADAGTFEANREALANQQGEFRARTTSFTPSLLYNPVGKMLLAGAQPSFVDYALRVYDGDALMRAVHAKAGLLSHNVAAAGAQAYLDAAPAGQRDAYSGAALHWDAATHSILVTQKGSRPIPSIPVTLATP